MSPYYYLERQSMSNPRQVISLGVFTGNTFFPTMPYEVFKILVKEAKFTIQDDSGNKFNLNTFEDKISHTFGYHPPVISLNTGS